MAIALSLGRDDRVEVMASVAAPVVDVRAVAMVLADGRVDARVGVTASVAAPVVDVRAVAMVLADGRVDARVGVTASLAAPVVDVRVMDDPAMVVSLDGPVAAVGRGVDGTVAAVARGRVVGRVRRIIAGG